MYIDYQLLGKRIAKLRRERGLTQERVAELADISNNFISHIETSRSIPSLETVLKLCDVLQVTPDALLLGTGSQSREYLTGDILRKLESCTPQERRLIDGFIDLLIQQREKQ